MSEPTDEPRAETSGGNVLVVDDSPVIRTIVGAILRAAGFTVAEASDGAAAVGMLDLQAFDVVVTDMNMPGLDGLGVLAAVRKQGIGTEVIILTGARARDMESAIQALRLGAHDYLSKPPSGPEVVVLAVQRAMDKKRLHDTNLALVAQLKALSTRDGLTGLLNRRSFDETFELERVRARRYKQPLSVLMVDLDHFKAINDRYGHPGGDVVLRSFSAIAKDVLRETDLVYRYGGEEFAVLLPNTNGPGGLEAGRRLVAALAATAISVGDADVHVTCSVGAACIEVDSPDGSDVVAQADDALYKAKTSGRNRAVAAAFPGGLGTAGPPGASTPAPPSPATPVPLPPLRRSV